MRNWLKRRIRAGSKLCSTVGDLPERHATRHPGTSRRTDHPTATDTLRSSIRMRATTGNCLSPSRNVVTGKSVDARPLCLFAGPAP